MYTHKCSKCNGTGDFQRVHSAVNPEMASCLWCDGTGVRELKTSPAKLASLKAWTRRKEVEGFAKYRVVEIPEKEYEPYDYDI